jgi:hypothetical protein
MIVMVMLIETGMSVEDVTEHWGFRLMMHGHHWGSNGGYLVEGIERRRKACGRGLLTRW